MPLREKGFLYMKMAIIGATHQALQAILYFEQLGINLNWFPNLTNESQLQEKLQYNVRSEFNPDELILKLKEIETKTKIIWRTIQSVSKAYLATSENLANRSRLCDLFRITTTVNVQSVINEQMQNNQQLFGNLKPEVVESLMAEQDGYEDFDIVIDTTLFEGDVNWIGGQSPVMGEARLKSFPGLYYGTAGLSLLSDGLTPDMRESAIIGSNDVAAKLLHGLLPHLEQKLDRIFIVSRDEEPFSNLRDTKQKEMTKLDLATEREKFEVQIRHFEQKHHEWLELESYMQAKVPQPTEPIPSLVFFSGHSVIAADRLIDRDRFYLTCEIPSFRQAKLHKENAELPLKTIGVDAILVTDELTVKQDMYRPLRTQFWNQELLPLQPEDGFFSLGLDDVTQQLNTIEIELMKFFSRKD